MQGKGNKQRITFTMDPELIEKLREISARTMIPQARLVEAALKKVIEEYEPKNSDK